MMGLRVLIVQSDPKRFSSWDHSLGYAGAYQNHPDTGTDQAA
ncbi:MAG TPA: hypothetical protein VF355_02655 [Anaerolineaceae bacterium]